MSSYDQKLHSLWGTTRTSLDRWIRSSGIGESRLWPLASWLVTYRFIFLNLLFVFYIYKVQPVLLNRLVSANSSGQSVPGLVWLVILFQLAELLGAELKMDILFERISRWPGSGMPGILVFGLGALLHLGIAFIFLILMAPLMGFNLHDPSLLNGLAFIALFIFMIVKEGLVIQPFIEGPRLEQVNIFLPEVQVREAIADLLLMIFAMFSFTLTWDFMVLTIPPVENGAWLPGLLGGLLLFVMSYLPSRLIFMAEEWMVARSRLTRITSAVTFLVTLYICISNIPG